ncbi:MAG: BatD family protein [Bacteroidetes bacterium]|nr:BatD family protein [Bacteroidota bacterium]
MLKKIGKNLMNFIKVIFTNFIFIACLLSQDESFTASVNNTNPQIGEPISLTFSLSGAGVGGARNFRQPDLSNFSILSGPNQSTSMQFINGNVSSSFSISFDIQPNKEGKIIIGSATIEAGGKQYSSNTIELNILKSSQSQPKQQSNITSSENLFLQAFVDRSKVYVGEQINVTYKIYTRLKISNYSIKAFPSTQGFWVEEIPQNQQVQLTNEVVNGIQYQVGELKRIALFPTQSGSLEIKPFEINCQVQVPTRRRSNNPFDIFNDPFFSSVQTQNIQIKSQPVKINVMSLPQNNIPKSFSGAVGKYEMNISTSKTETQTNEAITLKMKISGTGNLKLIETPKLELSNEFELYDPKTNDNVNLQSKYVSGTRTYEWLVIPKYPGNKKIPQIEWSYFNPSSNNYVTLNSKEIKLKINQGAVVAGQTSSISKEEIEFLNQDVRFIKTKSFAFTNINNENSNFILRIILYLLPILIAGGILFFRIKNEKAKFDIIGYKSKKASRVAKNKLKLVESLLKNGDDSKFVDELSYTLTKYICDKINIPFSQLTIDEIIKQLTNRKINQSTIDLFVNLQQSCEVLRFAPKSEINSTKGELFNDSIKVISRLEEEIK